MNARRICACLATAVIMGAVSGFVNAKEPVLTKNKLSRESAKPRVLTVREFAQRMMSKAKFDRLAPPEAQAHHLNPFAPIKLYSVKSDGPEWSNRWCDLVLEGTLDRLAPHCLVLIKKQKDGGSVTFTSYRMDLDGKLESAHRMTGRNGPDGKPIHGSAVDTDLDAKVPAVQKAATQELEFWLSRDEGSK